jgi:hypothetical protein
MTLNLAARDWIDSVLACAAWPVQDHAPPTVRAARGVALREVLLRGSLGKAGDELAGDLL